MRHAALRLVLSVIALGSCGMLSPASAGCSIALQGDVVHCETGATPSILDYDIRVDPAIRPFLAGPVDKRITLTEAETLRVTAEAFREQIETIRGKLEIDIKKFALSPEFSKAALSFYSDAIAVYRAAIVLTIRARSPDWIVRYSCRFSRAAQKTDCFRRDTQSPVWSYQLTAGDALAAFLKGNTKDQDLSDQLSTFNAETADFNLEIDSYRTAIEDYRKQFPLEINLYREMIRTYKLAVAAYQDCRQKYLIIVDMNNSVAGGGL